MTRHAKLFGGIALVVLAAFSAPALAQNPQGPSYQVVGGDANSVELRFRGVPLKGVHADDAQNALSLDFQAPVDGAVFDRLPGDLPQWVNMAYANFDNGVIRASRPVTFLTRSEPDGFSLRIVARGPAQPQMAPPQLAQNVPPPPPMRGPAMDAPPPDVPFHRYDDYSTLRGYLANSLAVRRADPVLGLAYGRAAMQADSSITLSGEGTQYHGGDQVITGTLAGKFTILPGFALVGEVQGTDEISKNTRDGSGNIITHSATALVSGLAGFAFELGADSELKLEASQGNDVTGARVSVYTGDPDGFIAVTGDYHTPYLDTPTAILNKADRDQVTVAGAQRLGWAPWGELWGSLAGHYTRYGLDGDEDIGQTAGWDANLRWSIPLYDTGLLAGIAYDGHGEYVLSNDTYAGGPPSPYIPLGLRNIETHAVTASLSTPMWYGFWLAAYGGYVDDRYASDGLLAGLDLHYMPADGVDLALGFRQSAVSYTQGETGRQTSAGLNLTMGFGAPPQPSWMLNSL